MPGKIKKLEREVGKLPAIPKELVNQSLTGPMTGEAINAVGSWRPHRAMNHGKVCNRFRSSSVLWTNPTSSATPHFTIAISHVNRLDKRTCLPEVDGEQCGACFHIVCP